MRNVPSLLRQRKMLSHMYISHGDGSSRYIKKHYFSMPGGFRDKQRLVSSWQFSSNVSPALIHVFLTVPKKKLQAKMFSGSRYSMCRFGCQAYVYPPAGSPLSMVYQMYTYKPWEYIAYNMKKKKKKDFHFYFFLGWNSLGSASIAPCWKAKEREGTLTIIWLVKLYTRRRVELCVGWVSDGKRPLTMRRRRRIRQGGERGRRNERGSCMCLVEKCS